MRLRTEIASSSKYEYPKLPLKGLVRQMRLTKYTQSCFRLEEAGDSLVIDPGMFSELDVALKDVGAVLITHEDPDHVDLDAVRSAAKADKALRVWAPPAVASALSELDGQVVAAAPGQSFDAAGFAIETLGGQHGLIHSSIPVVANVGYLIGGEIYHPGDSFVVPEKQVETLLLPIDAPWAKMADVMDFVAAVRAPFAVPMHEFMLSDFGRNFVIEKVGDFGARYGTDVHRLEPRETITL